MTYTPLSLSADDPFTLIEALALYNNLAAAMLGEAGAPRLRSEALATAANGSLPTLTVSAADTFDLTEGTFPGTGTLTTGSVAFVSAASWTIGPFTGSIRVRWTHQTIIQAGSSELRKNGTAISNFGTSGNTTVARSVDVSVSPSDVLSIWHQTAAGGGSSIISGQVLRASNAYVAKTVWGSAV